MQFTDQPFTDKMLAVLAQLLPDLDTLDLRSTGVSDDGLRALAGMKKLRQLSLPIRNEFTAFAAKSDCTLNGSGLVHIGQLTELQTLNCGYADVTDATVKHLTGLKKLEVLDLSLSLITTAVITTLAELPELKTLTLLQTPIDNTALKELAKLKKLQGLDLRKTRVTGQGFAALKDVPGLTFLTFANTPVTDAGLQELAAVKSLRMVDASDTKVTKAGVDNLKKALPNVTVTGGN